MRCLTTQRGFTLVELVMVIVIMGVVAGTVAVFMKNPIDAYIDSARRAGLTDVADTTARRLARDLRKALPNSIRTPVTTPPNQCLEFIPTKTGGRYRADETPAGLDFTVADTEFNMLGSNSALPADQRIGVGDVLVVYNLGVTGADAYAQDNTANVTNAIIESGSPPETNLEIEAKKFPFESANKRFHVVPAAEKVVAYVCSGGQLRRTVSSTFASNCPATGPTLANNVSDCSFDYSGTDLQRNALIRMVFAFTEADETVRLQHEVHVSNAP